MERKEISERLRARIGEIYDMTRNVVRINGGKSEEFWTYKGVRQDCPLSPTLFTLYVADLEDVMRKGQAGGIVIGSEKIWTLAYADDMVLIAKERKELKEMMRRLEKYLDRRKLELNADKTKVLTFKKGRGKKKKEEWRWKDEEI